MPMPDTLPLAIPDGATLRRLREEIGLSQSELADELGFKEGSGADIVRAWEKGERSGKPCHPTPLAWRCFRLMVVAVRAVSMGGCTMAVTYLRANLTERLQ